MKTFQNFRRSHIIAVSLAFLVPAILATSTTLLLWTGYLNAQEAARARASSASQVVAANFVWVLEIAKQLLERVDDVYGDNLDNNQDINSKIKDDLTTLPGEPKIYLVDVSGRTLLTTDSDFKPIDVRDREYFQALNKGKPFFISQTLISRLNQNSIFVVSKRIERNGAFAGAAMISFNTLLIEKVWLSLGLDETSTVSIFREDGQLVSRYPPSGPLDLSGYRLFTELLPAAPQGIYEAISPADGVSRIVAYRRITGTPLIALASIGRDSTFLYYHKVAVFILALAIPIVTMLFVLAFLVSRWIDRDIKREKQLVLALDRNQELFAEIHHRVKNNLQAVMSLIRIQKIDEQTKRDVVQRILSMVAVHEHIYNTNQFDIVDTSKYIADIVKNVVTSYNQKIDVEIKLASVFVDKDFALPLGLIVSEVVSNAMKYAFKNNNSGRLEVTIKPDDSGKAVLTIKDSGPGFDPDSTKSGMGSTLIKGFVSQVNGIHTYRFEQGTVFELKFNSISAISEFNSFELAHLR